MADQVPVADDLAATLTAALAAAHAQEQRLRGLLLALADAHDRRIRAAQRSNPTG